MWEGGRDRRMSSRDARATDLGQEWRASQTGSFAAMSYSDSAAVFTATATEIGLTETEMGKLKTAGLQTMAEYAFCCNFAPGSSDEKPFADVMTTVFGTAPDIRLMSRLRRLFSESYSAVAAEMKSKVESTDDSPAKRLAPADRAVRMSEQQARLSGMSLRGPYEPGDSLVDKAVSIYESGRLTYIDWGTAVSREHELSTGLKKDASLSFDASGVLKLNKREVCSPTSTASEMAVRMCLTRRGLALEQANILAFSKHVMRVEKLFYYRLQEVPSGFAAVTLQQMEQADKKFFVMLAESCREGIKMTPKGRPCDLHFKDCFDSVEFLSLLVARPLAVGGRASNPGPNPKRARLEGDDPKGKGKGKKGKGKGSNKDAPPKELTPPAAISALGGISRTSKGVMICYDYNMSGGCKREVFHQKCTRGLHVCAVRNCHRQHPATECPNATKA